MGDWHSTVKAGEGEGERSGRWKGKDKTECGLHKDYFEMKEKSKVSEVRSSLSLACLEPFADRESLECF